MIAGTLEVQLLANMARLQQDMDQAKRVVGGAMSSIESAAATAKGALIGLGAVGLATAFGASIKSAIDLADELNKLSQRTGLSVESLSQLRYAAKLSDVSADSLNTGIKKLNVSIAGGIAGDKEKVALFKELGVTLTDTSGRTKTADQVLLDIADTFAKSRDGAGKTAAAYGLLGKAGDEMIPLLNGGSEAIKAMMLEADKLGLTIGSDFAKQAEEFNDNLTRIQVSAQKTSILFAGEFVDGLGRAMKSMADATIEGGKLYGVFKGLQTLLTGDDMHKSNVLVYEGVERLLAAENALTSAQARGDDANVARLTNAVKLRKEELAVNQNYNKMLNGEADKAAQAGKAAETARTKGREIKVGGGAASSGPSKFDSYLKSLQNQLDKVRELTVEENLYEDIKRGQLGKLAPLQEKELAMIARKIDLSKAEKESLKDSEAAGKKAAEEAGKVFQEYQQFFEAYATPAEKLANELERIAKIGENNPLMNSELLAMASTKAWRDYVDTIVVAQKEVSELDEFSKKAAENIQDSLGSGLNDMLNGNFDNIGSSFTRMINRMIAEAAAAQLSRAMFGDMVKGGEGAGLFGGALKSFGSSLLGVGNLPGTTGDFARMDRLSFDGGGYTGTGARSGGLDGKGGFMAMMHPQETVIDHSKGQTASGGANITLSNSITVAGGVSSGEAYTAIQKALAANNKQWTEQLKKQGVLA